MAARNDDPFDLARFVVAQDRMYEAAIRELRDGAKQSHWIWYIFPQVSGLGSSAMSARYAIRSKEEARAYLDHSILRQHLLECVDALLGVSGKTAGEIMGSPDDLKLRSSMTLFAAVSTDASRFREVLDRYFDGRADPATVRFLEEH